MKLDAKTTDIMSNITDTVIKAMEAGTAPWQKPWINRYLAEAPINPTTKKVYRGMNSLYLQLLSDLSYGGCPYWMGFKQARKLGGHVRKGEKSTAILAPIMRKGEDKDTGEEYMYPAGFRVVRVFNAMQCDGLNLPATEPTDAEPRTLNADALDDFVTATGAAVAHGFDRACFIPSQDLVQMPEKDQFTSEGGYYGTLLHELIHWTGHKSRLNRLDDKSKRGYAFEELIAELGAYYASELIGCPNEAENHASYLESWLKALQSDVQYLWQAASLAEKAAHYLIDLTTKGQADKAA